LNLRSIFQWQRRPRRTKVAVEAIDRDIRRAQDLLTRTSPPSSANLQLLVENFAPLVEWQYWSRDQKRSVLAALVPDIRVANYKIAALGIDPSVFSNQNTRMAAGYLIAERLIYLPIQPFEGGQS
jgi:hypothetical protein